MRLGRAGLRRRAVADDALHDDQRRAALVREDFAIGRVERGQIVGILHGEHVPAQAAEPRGHVLAERQIVSGLRS